MRLWLKEAGKLHVFSRRLKNCQSRPKTMDVIDLLSSMHSLLETQPRSVHGFHLTTAEFELYRCSGWASPSESEWSLRQGHSQDGIEKEEGTKRQRKGKR